MQVDGAIRHQEAIRFVANLFIVGNLTTVSEDATTVEMYDEANEKISMVSNEVLKASLNESLELVYNHIEENKTLPESVLLDVPLVEQLPELPTACEITALTMVFN